MNKKIKKICFVSISFSPELLGGTNLVNKNLINYIHSRKKDIEIYWVYFGKENKKYSKENVNYIELKSPIFSSPLSIRKSIKLAKFFRKNFFDVISARTGIWVNIYKKRDKQDIIQTYHGTRYYFNKNHFRRLNFIQKGLLFILLGTNWIVDKPSKEAKRLICVSEKVKKQVQKLYGNKNELVVIRTGVNLDNFKPRNIDNAKKILELNEKYTYGLYVGKGGYWTKGLDRAINLSEKIYKKNNKYRLIVIGPDLKKIKKLLPRKFIMYIKEVKRDEMPFYYNASEIFFCMSRYEGGAPTLVVSEAMASGCFLVCSKDSQQEIIQDEKNGLIINKFDEEDAKRIVILLNNKKKKQEIIKNSIKTIKDLSLEKWGEKYLNALMN
jgi:glycosyltransferase involved in cell wall biosynthesis